MSMHTNHEPSQEYILQQVQKDVLEIRSDVDSLQRFVTGEGDPSKGMLWAVTDLVRMVASLSTLVDEQRKSLTIHAALLRDHELGGHQRRETPIWQRLTYDTARQVITVMVSVVLLLILMGTQTWIRSQ